MWGLGVTDHVFLGAVETVDRLRVEMHLLQGYLAHKKHPTPLGPPQVPRHRATVGSYGGGVYHERGTPAQCCAVNFPGVVHSQNPGWPSQLLYRNTSVIRNSPLVGSYRKTVSRAPWP